MALNGYPYLLFYLGEEIYALSAEFVREMILAPSVSALPGTAADIRGVINLRGKVVQIVDLRLRLGMQSLSEELQAFDDMLQQRKQEHVHWLEELEACIREKRDFRLATNPHECNFGRWYYSFKTNNALLAKYLPRFESPHDAIHGTASEAIAALHAGHTEQALAIVEGKRNNELAEVLKIFDNVMQVLRETNTEIAVVLISNGKPAAITVDRVLSVEHLPPENLQDPPDVFAGSRHILKIGRRKSDELVSVLDPDSLTAG